MIYDIIGDIHGHASRLVRLLNTLGYQENAGTYRHPEPDRLAVFVGDFIDRGPEIRETLALTRSMIECGNALAVMGNHEYNAICFAEDRAYHDWMRARNDKHLHQHLETIYQFRNHRSEWADHLNWFKTLPLFLRLDAINVVHASWNEKSIGVLQKYLNENGRIRNECLELFFRRATRRWNPEFNAIQVLLKGVELPLPYGVVFADKDGNRRSDVRITWWNNTVDTFQDAVFPGEPDFCDAALTNDHKSAIPGYAAEQPVFFGHYWLPPTEPWLQSYNVCCLDYSVAKHGKLVSYTWRGETKLTPSHFTWV